MARIDYGQVPAVPGPSNKKHWKKLTRINLPEAHRDFLEASYKWIDVKYLNGTRRFTEGSKALVGRRISTGRWSVICVKEAV